MEERKITALLILASSFRLIAFSYLPIFPASLFTSWSPKAKKQNEGCIFEQFYVYYIT